MSVYYYVCDKCGEPFSEYRDYVECYCGKKWCDNKCAEIDGFEEGYCKLGYDIHYEYPEDERCNKECCCACESFVKRSCSYCRKEKFTEQEMLEKALELLGISEEELTKEMRESNGQVRSYKK